MVQEIPQAHWRGIENGIEADSPRDLRQTRNRAGRGQIYYKLEEKKRD